MTLLCSTALCHVTSVHLRALTWSSLFLSLACASSPTPPPLAQPGVELPAEVTIAVVGTSDLHGHVEPLVFEVRDAAGVPHRVARGGLPLLGGYLANLRRRMPVVLLDGGDMFQGTLTSNLSEGQVVVEAYNVLGYTAVAIGNHEFDYGPVGPRSVVRSGTEGDPVGALKARAAAARFPFLAANVIEEATGRPVSWPNTYPSRLIEVPGVPGLRLGVVGATAEDTPRTTNPLNLRGLRIERVVPTVRAEARALRRQGAAAVLLAVHEGGDCRSLADPKDLRPCDNADGRVIEIARNLQGEVDAIVGGHSHAGVAHLVGEVPVVQSFMGGRFFGRIDLTFRQQGGRFVLDRHRIRIHRPTQLCQVAAPEVPFALIPPGRTQLGTCDQRHLAGVPLRPAVYEGQEVVPSAEVMAVIAPFVEAAAARRNAPLGVTLDRRLPRSHRSESELGRLLADLTREGAEAATGQRIDVALQNGGGIRADLPAGPLRYGELYEVLPFDNQLAVVRLPGALLMEVLRRNLEDRGEVLVASGLSGEARCIKGTLELLLYDRAGQPVVAERTYTVAVSDFLASGGSGFAAVVEKLPPGAVTVYEDLPPVRELIRAVLEKRKVISPPAGPRLRLPGPRPLRCG
ncbi:MAG: bifunctional UDP-sugar hydrolase/5'-nucleotidase [Myxococcales bacterium]|nr:bifunctional metallophosphatase/5'-nucleotidase [Myxococcota bacterium]MDW8282234.1 bifunctional UDP-sugar hydrolase/5'-nucleotidase [Myxococcales bacterium]